MKKKICTLIKETLAEEMRRDRSVFVIGEDVGVYGGPYKCTEGLLNEFGPGRIVDSPISEMGFTGVAVGAAWGGLKPVCEYMTFNFALQSLDHIINSAAKTLYRSGGRVKTPIVFRGPNGLSYGVGAQHTQDFSGLFSSLPGVKVVMPYSSRDHVGLLRAAIRDHNPVIVLESELLYPVEFDCAEEILKEDFILPLNKSVIECEGEEISILGAGVSVGLCLDAKNTLQTQGVSAEVINLISINPIDIDTIEKSVRKTKRLLVVDLGWPECGIASEVSSSISFRLFSLLEQPVFILSGRKVPTPYAEELEKMVYPSAEDIISAVNKMLCRMEYKHRK